ILIFFVLFFVPKSLWAGKVVFHFWYIVVVVVAQLLWALLIWRKVDIICPLTTWMQYLRGYKIKSDENYDHSFTSEFFQRLRLNINHAVVKIIIFICLFIVIIQYIWFR
ncbi:hypothetical protein KY339_02700, partial [Candidatus Woesearchaeota archaeon]|nr:hypothetical protein [Candidatus Woesearchaeota archaeon]